jgi:hypothetical protein
MQKIKTISIVTFIFVSFTFGQFSKGLQGLEGTASVMYSSDSDIIISLSPSIEYFLSDQFAINSRMNIISYDSNTIYNLGVGVKRYQVNTESPLYIGLGFNYGKVSDNLTSTSLLLEGGLLKRMSRGFYFDFGVDVHQSFSSGGSTIVTTGVGIKYFLD